MSILLGFLPFAVLLYQLIMIILMGWNTDIREGFVEIMIMNGMVTLLIYLYMTAGWISPIFIFFVCILIFNIGSYFVDDSADKYPHSLRNIFIVK